MSSVSIKFTIQKRSFKALSRRTRFYHSAQAKRKERPVLRGHPRASGVPRWRETRKWRPMKRPLPLFLADGRDAKGHGIAVSPFVGADVGASRLQSSPHRPALILPLPPSRLAEYVKTFYSCDHTTSPTSAHVSRPSAVCASMVHEKSPSLLPWQVAAPIFGTAQDCSADAWCSTKSVAPCVRDGSRLPYPRRAQLMSGE